MKWEDFYYFFLILKKKFSDWICFIEIFPKRGQARDRFSPAYLVAAASHCPRRSHIYLIRYKLFPLYQFVRGCKLPELLCNILNRAFAPAKSRCRCHELIINCLNAPPCLRSVLLRTAKTVLQRGTDSLQFLPLLLAQTISA